MLASRVDDFNPPKCRLKVKNQEDGKVTIYHLTIFNVRTHQYKNKILTADEFSIRRR